MKTSTKVAKVKAEVEKEREHRASVVAQALMDAEAVCRVLADCVRSGTPVLWVVLSPDKTTLRGECPHCKVVHIHGAASDRGPVWGPRGAHCASEFQPNGSYVLVSAAYRPELQVR